MNASPPSLLRRLAARAGGPQDLRGAGFLALSLAAIAAGVLLRWRMAHLDRSLWLDPAMLVLNLVERGYGELFRPLGLNQSAPYGFLCLLKAAGDIGDYRESALLVPPFLASLVALLAFARLAFRVLGRDGAPFAVAPFALSSTAVYYAGEVKQYSFELAAAALVLLLAWSCAESGFARRESWRFAIGSALLGWFAHSSLLVTAASLLGLGWIGWRAAEREARRRFAGLGAALAAHHVLLYLVQMRPAAGADLFAYHAAGFAPWPPWRDFSWYRDTLMGYLAFPLGSPGATLLPLLGLGLGLLALRGRRREAALVLGPLAALYLASALRFFPVITGENDIHSRLTLFTLPFVCLLLGRGFASLLPPGNLAVGTLLLAALSYPAAARSFGEPGYLREEMAPLVVDLEAQIEPGDQIYVFHAAEPAFRFYTRRHPLAHVAGEPMAMAEEALRRDAAKLGAGRVWVVFAHFYSGEDFVFRGILEERGDRLQKHIHDGTVLELYLLRPPESRRAG